MLLLFDNYDSFTYNIYQLLASLGAEVEVVRNDAVTPEDVLAAHYEAVILSPGPGLPKDAGNLEMLIEVAKGKVPLSASASVIRQSAKRQSAAITRSSSSANPCPTASPSPPNWKTARSWACATRSTPSRASSSIPNPS